MSSYLEVVCGDYRFLIQQALVEEVISLDFGRRNGATELLSDSEQGFFTWRDKNIPVLDLRCELDMPENRSKHQVVINQSQEAVDAYSMLVVDEVAAIHDLPDERFLPVPGFNDKFSKMIDASCPVGQSDECYLRIKQNYFS